MSEKRKKILIADDSTYWNQKVLHSAEAKNYHLKFVKNGNDCLRAIKSFQPDLIVVKLMLFPINGIEILMKVKTNPKMKHIGVIIVSAKQTIQDYHAAIEAKADFFLIKPYKVHELFLLFSKFFAKTLKPKPFSKAIVRSSPKQVYAPSFDLSDSYLKFWGTRGSITVSGMEYTRFGGNTSCLEIRLPNELVIIDAGTGIRELGFEVLRSKVRTIHLFLGHTHWDHIIGFPFFEPLYHSKYEIHIWGPKGFGRKTQDLFTDLLAYEFFPIRLDEVQAKLHFHEISDRVPVQINKHIKLDFHFTFHPGMTYCFKLHLKDRIIGYATDNEILLGYLGAPNQISLKDPRLDSYRTLIDFFKECDLLIHEAQYTPKEYIKKIGWGHSSISNVAILIKYAKIKKWIVTHHDPKHTDPFLVKKHLLHKKILKECKIPCQIIYAFDGYTIEL